MERFFIPSIYLGAIAGVIFGILLLLPFIAPFIALFMFLLSGIISVVILKRSSAIGILTIYDGCFIGAVSGFISLVTASIIYLPISNFFGGYISSIMAYNLLAIFMVVFSTAILSALFNAFSGLVTAFIFEKLGTKNMSFEDHFEIEQNEDI